MRVKAMLLDLEGVLYEGDRPIEGATAAVARLREMQLDLRYLTNTTPQRTSAVSN